MEWLFKILKFFVVLFVLLVIAAAVVFGIAYNEGRKRAEKANSRLEVAEAMFQERCKRAGVKIHRTVDGVEGIFVMKLRPENVNDSRQFDMDDPYGRDSSGEGYLHSLLRGSWEANIRGTPTAGTPPPPIGFLYLDVIDSKDGIRYRYTGRIEEPWQADKSYAKGYTRFVLDRVPAKGAPPRYGVTYDDISTHQDREYWIAGSSLKVVDLKTGEVIAERIGYMMDLGQGADGGGRSPWLYAADYACPGFSRKAPQAQTSGPVRTHHGALGQWQQTLHFVEKSLKPKMER